MYSFSNSFRFTNKADGTESLLQFLQTIPVYEEGSTKIIDVKREEVICIAMHPDRARDLANSILEVLDNPPSLSPSAKDD